MGGRNVHELILLDQAGQALAEAQSFEEIKDIRDKAEAVRKYAQSASLGLDIQNRAAELKLRAERHVGQLLAQMTLRGGDRRSKHRNERLKLDDLGISRNQSTRWQLQAKVPDNLFCEHIKQTCDAGKELTSAGVMRLAKRWDDSIPAHGHANGNGHSPRNGDSTSDARHSRDGRPQTPDTQLNEIATELMNHHQVLDGILRPIYSGESTSLHAAECRVLRYLLLETLQLLTQLGKLPPRSSALHVPRRPAALLVRMPRGLSRPPTTWSNDRRHGTHFPAICK